MKPLALLLLGLSLTNLQAQQIPNAGFDSVYIGGIDRIFEWITSDGVSLYAGEINDTVQALLPDTSYQGPGFLLSELLHAVNVAYNQPFNSTSIKIQSVSRRKKIDGSAFPSFIISGEHLATDSAGYPDFFRSGYAFAHRPDSLKGYYMFSDSLSAVDNWGKVLLFLSKYNPLTQSRDTIAYLNSTLDLNPASQWTAFSLPIPYLSQEIPDSLSLSFFPSIDPLVFGVLWLDELEFVYSGTTSLKPSVNGSFQIFPNPVKDILTLSQGHEAWETYELLDMQGKIRLRGKVTKNIDLSSLPSGLYIFRVEGPKRHVINRKIVKI